jgi:RNA recognition motif-containing protein
MTSSTPQIRSDGSSMVDYTNLYIKNLDPDVKSADLFSNFRKFGRIISARVMKNAQTNQSKGFGFVSFSKADEAQKAKQEMNNQYILSKAVIVAFHEPKKVRDIEVSPPNSTFNASYQQQQQQQIAASVSPVLVQHQQSTYTRPSPTQPTAVNSPQSNLFEQQKYPQQQQQQMQIYHYQQQQSTNGYSNGHSMKNNHQDVPDQRYNTRNTMPVSQKYNNSNSYQQPDLHQPSPTPTNGQTSNYYQPMARNNSSSSGYHHHTNNGLGIYEQQRQQQQQNQVP